MIVVFRSVITQGVIRQTRLAASSRLSVRYPLSCNLAMLRRNARGENEMIDLCSSSVWKSQIGRDGCMVFRVLHPLARSRMFFTFPTWLRPSAWRR